MAFPWTAPSRPKNAPPKIKKAESVDIKWSRSYPARIARTAIIEAGWRPIVKIFARPHIKGIELLSGLNPKTPIIFTANHRSHADTPILLTSIPEPWRHRLIVGAARDYFFKNKLTSSFFALTIGAIPVERTKIDRSSLQLVNQLIKKGWSLLIYPEGGRTPDGWGRPFQAGAAYLASLYDIPVVPIYMEGTDRVLSRGSYFPRFSKSLVAFGSPIFAQEGESTRSMAQRISESTNALADELASDWWQARKRQHKGTSPKPYGPDTVSWRRHWSLPIKAKTKNRTAKNPW